MERKNAWKKYSDEDKKNVFTFADEYRTFISECKTERECVKKAVELAKKAGTEIYRKLLPPMRHLRLVIKYMLLI